eukprot:SAG22_NODE_1681_length_3818_cov_1.844313_3_plen_524_part_00
MPGGAFFVRLARAEDTESDWALGSWVRGPGASSGLPWRLRIAPALRRRHLTIAGSGGPQQLPFAAAVRGPPACELPPTPSVLVPLSNSKAWLVARSSQLEGCVVVVEDRDKSCLPDEVAAVLSAVAAAGAVAIVIIGREHWPAASEGPWRRHPAPETCPPVLRVGADSCAVLLAAAERGQAISCSYGGEDRPEWPPVAVSEVPAQLRRLVVPQLLLPLELHLCLMWVRIALSLVDKAAAAQMVEAVMGQRGYGAVLPLLGPQYARQPGVQHEAAWIVTNLAASTAAHAKQLLDYRSQPGAGGFPASTSLVSALLWLLNTTDSPDIQEQCAWALGNIAGDDGTGGRDQIIKENNGVAVLLRTLGKPYLSIASRRSEQLSPEAAARAWAEIQPPPRQSAGETLAFTLSNCCRGACVYCGVCCGERSPGICRPCLALHGCYPAHGSWVALPAGKPKVNVSAWEEVRPMLPVLAALVELGEGDAPQDACWALSYLSDGRNEQIQEVLDCTTPSGGAAPTHQDPAIEA